MNKQASTKPSVAALAEFVEANGLALIAAACGVTYQAVQKWLRKKRVPAEHCIRIEAATSGSCSRYDLRPDVFGEAPSPALQEAG